MAKKSGIPVELIIKFGGIPKQLITKLGGKITADLGFGPDYVNISCTTVYYGYSSNIPGGDLPVPIGTPLPVNPCKADQLPYEWDAVNGILYTEGGCGTEIAKGGSYSDGTTIYIWDGDSSRIIYGPCPKKK